MPDDLAGFEVLSFDCYGTLIDWETGLWEAFQPLLGRSQAGVGRSALLSLFSQIEPDVEAETPGAHYAEILAVTHRRVADHLGLPTTDDLDWRFAGSVGDWPAFADSSQALTALSKRYRLVILSNVDNTSFAGSQRRLGVDFDAVYTAEEIGSYKPDPRNFRFLIDRVRRDFGVGPERLAHVAQSLFHDHVPAAALGLATVWIDRQRLSEGGEPGATPLVDEAPQPDHTFLSMAELAEAAVGRA